MSAKFKTNDRVTILSKEVAAVICCVMWVETQPCRFTYLVKSEVLGIIQIQEESDLRVIDDV